MGVRIKAVRQEAGRGWSVGLGRRVCRPKGEMSSGMMYEGAWWRRGVEICRDTRDEEALELLGSSRCLVQKVGLLG